ncbi:MAG TPA: HNH endonuclease signature motif containing protein, partial [Acidimicrobiales bacterium]
CPKRRGLQIDHCDVDYRDDGPTEISNLVRICAEHHDQKTHGGWRLTGSPGQRQWIAPPHPPSAQQINRTRKVAAARGKANRIRD